MTETVFFDQLRAWLLAHNPKIAPDAVTEETALIENRILTSSQVMDLLLYLEELTGRPLSPEQLKPGVFHSMRTIYQHFASE